jgi:DHA2 family multidrug resistance protein-like MFS transporter
MILGCLITSAGIILLSTSFLYTWQYMIAAFIGFTLFGIGLGFYATPSADAALSNVPSDQAGSAAGLYKMASSLGAAFGVAVSASIFTALSGMDLSAFAGFFLGRTDNVSIRLAAMAALLFNFLMIMATISSIVNTIPKKEMEEENEDLASAEC